MFRPLLELMFFDTKRSFRALKIENFQLQKTIEDLAEFP